MADESNSSFWQFPAEMLMQSLKSSEKGLSEQEAATRLVNSSDAKKPRSWWWKDLVLFAGQFKSPLMLMLIGAVMLSAFLGDTSDVFIILFIVLSTGLLSFYQECNASRIVEKLQSMISLKTSVLRDGAVREIATTKLVSGDIIYLQAGAMIPADCLLLNSNELHANEASLTGESYPVRKEAGVLEAKTELSKRVNCLWEGTNVVSGSGMALVVHTGKNTIFGSIAQSAGQTVESTFEKGIKDFGFFLMKITLFLSVFILVMNLVNHKSVVESALFALALAVGMAPELLPAITTIAMSAGAKRMLAKKVIVKKLASIQNLGEVSLLCTDKTGTITEGLIKVAGLVNGQGEEDTFVRQLAYWNAFFETGYANPIDDALKHLTVQNAVPAKATGEIPYDFIRKCLSIAIQTENNNLLITKGAFSQISSMCTQLRTQNGTTVPIGEHLGSLNTMFAHYGTQVMRVIGICYKEITSSSIDKADERDMIFAGFVLMEDPIKAGIVDTIAALNQLQVKLKIITGDNRNVAESIARKIGLSKPNIMTGETLFNTSPEALKLLVKKTHIFAEVEPQQKERIINALRKSYTVAYIGDGINDVSAINAADVGISVENAVDVAREAADFVLMEKNLMVLVDGIKEGRKTFANTLKYLFISTGSTFGNMCSVAAASLILPFLPMLPKQILLTNFLTDFPFLMVASDNVDEEQLDKPGRWDLKLIRNYMLVFGIHSALFDMFTFFTLLFLLKTQASDFQTGWFIESVLSEIFILFIIRTHKNFFKSQASRYLYIFSAIGVTLTIALPYLPLAAEVGLRPLPLLNLSVMLGIVILYVVTADLLKVWFFKTFRSA